MLKNKHFLSLGVVGPDRRRSATWLIWADDPATAPRPTAGVYITSKSLFGTFKASLHASGQWSSGLTSEFLRTHPVKGARARRRRRKFTNWDRQAPLWPGVTLAFRLLIPGIGLSSPNPEQDLDDTTYWLPDTGPERAIEISLLLTRPGLEMLEINPTPDVPIQKVGHYFLSSGENLVIFARDIPVVGQMREELGKAIGLLNDKAAGLGEITDGHPRALFFVDHLDGGKSFVDVACPCPPLADVA